MCSVLGNSFDPEVRGSESNSSELIGGLKSFTTQTKCVSNY